MAVKKATVINPKPETTALARKSEAALDAPGALRLVPVDLKDTAVALASVSGLPDGWEESESLEGFPPSPEWTTPGQCIFGDFIAVRNDVGPNNSRIYEISTYQGEGMDPLAVTVWGSAVIDRLFDSAYPPVTMGDRIGFIYLGTKDSGAGKNATKLFTMKVLRKNGKVSTR